MVLRGMHGLERDRILIPDNYCLFSVYGCHRDAPTLSPYFLSRVSEDVRGVSFAGDIVPCGLHHVKEDGIG